MEYCLSSIFLCRGKALKSRKKSPGSDKVPKSPVFRGQKYQNVKSYILSFLLRNKKLFLRFSFLIGKVGGRGLKY